MTTTNLLAAPDEECHHGEHQEVKQLFHVGQILFNAASWRFSAELPRKVVADGTLTSASTNDGWPNDDFRNLLVEAAKQKGWSEDVYTQDLIIKKISVGKVKADYKDIENVLVVTIKLHGDIPENITAATLLPFSTYQTEDRSFIGTTTLFSPSAKSPDLKTFLTTEASSGKKLTDRNWGFDYVGLD